MPDVVKVMIVCPRPVRHSHLPRLSLPGCRAVGGGHCGYGLGQDDDRRYRG
jgi:hypothetical protein